MKAEKNWISKYFGKTDKALTEPCAVRIDGNVERIDRQLGVSYAGDSEETYLLILGSYVKNGDENLEKIKNLLDEEKWKDYTIAVHTLKSTSLTIGAKGLSSLAAELELAGKNENYALIKEKNGELLRWYQDVLEEGRKMLAFENPEKTVDSGGNLDEITKEKLLEVRDKLKEACMAFSSNEIDSVMKEISSYTYRGVRLSEKVIKVKELADEFEYMEAGELTEKIFDEIGEN